MTRVFENHWDTLRHWKLSVYSDLIKQVYKRVIPIHQVINVNIRLKRAWQESHLKVVCREMSLWQEFQCSQRIMKYTFLFCEIMHYEFSPNFIWRFKICLIIFVLNYMKGKLKLVVRKRDIKLSILLRGFYS